VSDKKEVILIPYWIQVILARNQLPLSTCLDIEKIKPLISLNDLITFVSIQNPKYFELVLGAKNYMSDIISIWVEKSTKTNTAIRSFCYNTLVPISSDGTFNSELVTRLFTEESKDTSFKEPFIIYDLAPDVCGVVIYPGFFTQVSNKQLQKKVIESILEVLYVYMSFSEVAKTPLFKQYLEVLSPK
jgi:hypothetical protein